MKYYILRHNNKLLYEGDDLERIRELTGNNDSPFIFDVKDGYNLVRLVTKKGHVDISNIKGVVKDNMGNYRALESNVFLKKEDLEILLKNMNGKQNLEAKFTQEDVDNAMYLSAMAKEILAGDKIFNADTYLSLIQDLEPYERDGNQAEIFRYLLIKKYESKTGKKYTQSEKIKELRSQ